jgi:exodeoxyribonuclease-3
MDIISWNTNSLRKRFNDGHLKWFLDGKPDILCVQETKANEEQLNETLKGFDDYNSFYSSSTATPGYSGVAIFSKIKPVNVEDSFIDGNFKDEGRILKAVFDEFTLLNIYFPSGAGSSEKLKHKFEFYEYFLEETKIMQKKIEMHGKGSLEDIEITCPKCGKKLGGNETFCGVCGSKVWKR